MHRSTLLFVGYFLVASPAHGAPLLELKVGDDVYVGKSLAHDARQCCLMTRDGRLTRVPVDRITEFRQAAPAFRGLTTAEARSQLTQEVGRDFEVVARGRFVVAGPPGRAGDYAGLLDNVQRSFSAFFSRRGFRLEQPEFPLMVTVFPDRSEFAEYCRKDGMAYTSSLHGYYDSESNRVALYHSGEVLQSQSLHTPIPIDQRDHQLLTLESVRFGAVQGSSRDTLIHEATHQLAFNSNLHTRTGENPLWIVEGLATIFEQELAPRYGATPSANRINEPQFAWFRQRARGSLTDLAEFVTSDAAFRRNTLNAYSQAWALTHYLFERRQADFADYLRTIRRRPPFSRYTADERLADFQAHFGRDVGWLEVQWLRFMDELQ